MKKYIVLIILVILGLTIIPGCGSKQNNSSEIITYELQTHEYYEHLNNIPTKYYIDSQKELNEFYSLYENFEEMDINKYVFSNNKIFIQVIQESSGDINLDLIDVTFDNRVINFVIQRNGLGITEDMACWYLVAIIPNEKLNGIEFGDWLKPSGAQS